MTNDKELIAFSLENEKYLLLQEEEAKQAQPL